MYRTIDRRAMLSLEEVENGRNCLGLRPLSVMVRWTVARFGDSSSMVAVRAGSPPALSSENHAVSYWPLALF